MKNVGNYLVMKEFNNGESEEITLKKIKDIFEVSHYFVNLYDDEEETVEGDNGEIYHSELEKVFFTFKDSMSLKDLISKIGDELVDFDEQYSDFNIVSIEKEDKIIIAVSLLIHSI